MGSHAQVLAGRPHEAPVFSCAEPGSRAAIARVLSCPSMLAAQAAHYPARADTESTRKRPYRHPLSREDAAAASLEPIDDGGSENSAATATGAACAAMDTSPFAAFCKLSGCAVCLQHRPALVLLQLSGDLHPAWQFPFLF